MINLIWIYTFCSAQSVVVNSEILIEGSQEFSCIWFASAGPFFKFYLFLRSVLKMLIVSLLDINVELEKNV